MVLRMLLAILGGIGLGYGIAHLRYGDTSSIKQLQDDYTSLKSDYTTLQNEYTQLHASQQLIKAKAKELVEENKDYESIVSQLNRYYYQLQDIRENITTLQEKLGPSDQGFEKKLQAVQENTSPSTDSLSSSPPLQR